MSELYVGVAALMLPPLLVGVILFRRNQPVFFLLGAMVAIGTGYLVATGAAEDIGRQILAGKSKPAVAPAAK